MSVSCGQAQTCAVTAAGELYVWGRNECGQLGHSVGMALPVPEEDDDDNGGESGSNGLESEQRSGYRNISITFAQVAHQLRVRSGMEGQRHRAWRPTRVFACDVV